jgi:hypothetical protein
MEQTIYIKNRSQHNSVSPIGQNFNDGTPEQSGQMLFSSSGNSKTNYMRMKSIVSYLLMVVMLVFAMQSCKSDDDFLDLEAQALTTEFYYTTEHQAHEGLIGVYEILQSQALYGWKYSMMILPADDDFVDIDGWDFDVFASSMVEHEYTNQVWLALYVGVARANFFLEKVPEIEFEDDRIKNRLIAEASFLRAVYYWHLVNIWGEVPLITRVLSPGEGDIPKSTIDEIYLQIEEDLIFAEEHLWEKSEYPQTDLGRATIGAAKSLLGKLYVYWEKYDQAAVKLKEVIDSGEYDLIRTSSSNPDFYSYGYAFASVFSEEPLRGTGGENNQESVFEIQHSSWVGFPYGHWYELGNGANSTLREYVMGLAQIGGWSKCLPTADLAQSFEPDDPRRWATLYQVGDTMYADATPDSEYEQFVGMIYRRGSRSGHHAKKGLYPPFPSDTRGDIRHSGSNLRFLRYSDVLLLYAEALYHAGGGDPAMYIDMVRNRVGLKPVADLMAERGWDLPQAIMHERRSELAGEYQRFFDLRRYKQKGWIANISDYIYRTDSEGNQYTTFIDGKNEYFPLPRRELDLNRALVQNPNY